MDIAFHQGNTNIMNMLIEHFVNQMELSGNMENIHAEFGYYQ